MLTIANVEFDERDLNLIAFAKLYVERFGAFGASNHHSMLVIQKLASIVEKQNQFATELWRSKQ